MFRNNPETQTARAPWYRAEEQPPSSALHHNFSPSATHADVLRHWSEVSNCHSGGSNGIRVCGLLLSIRIHLAYPRLKSHEGCSPVLWALPHTESANDASTVASRSFLWPAGNDHLQAIGEEGHSGVLVEQAHCSSTATALPLSTVQPAG